MTDTTITLPIANDFARVPAQGLKRTASWFSTVGRGFAEALQVYSRAMGRAYSAPFQTPALDRKYGMDEDLEGRDPNW